MSEQKSFLEKVLDLFKEKGTVFVSELNSLNAGGGEKNYASKYVCMLKRVGYKFSTNKNGKAVISYVLHNPDHKSHVSLSPKKRGRKKKLTVQPTVFAEQDESAIHPEKYIKQAKELKDSENNPLPVDPNWNKIESRVDPEWDKVDDVKDLLR